MRHNRFIVSTYSIFCKKLSKNIHSPWVTKGGWIFVRGWNFLKVCFHGRPTPPWCAVCTISQHHCVYHTITHKKDNHIVWSFGICELQRFFWHESGSRVVGLGSEIRWNQFLTWTQDILRSSQAVYASYQLLWIRSKKIVFGTRLAQAGRWISKWMWWVSDNIASQSAPQFRQGEIYDQWLPRRVLRTNTTKQKHIAPYINVQ